MVDGCDICGLVRKAPRRLDTCFPKLLPGVEGGEARPLVCPWDPLQVPPEGRRAAAACRGAAAVPGQAGARQGLVTPGASRYSMRNLQVKA